MRLMLGIDGGGTGCRAALTDADGRVLGRGAGGPANISTDTAGASGNILAATRAALAEAGTGVIEDLTAVLGLAGANVPQAAARLSASLPFARHRVVPDSMTATIGALHGDDGIVAAIGTGSVFGVVRNGAFRSHGGHGFLLGDEGSGAVLGRALLSEALRATDGFTPMTPLLQEVLDEHGGPAGVIAFGLTARPADFARYAPQIVSGDDPAAERLFGAALRQISAVIDSLQMQGQLPVVFVGGLAEACATRLAGRWEIRAARGTGLDGALLLARQEG
ncbi:MAG: BadF/BadG/BcrA/BcrD ATPase family protein [Pseudorhodobacter sp.]